MAADYSGPRRARVELMADGRQLQTFVGEPLETVRRMSHACDGDCRPAVEQCHAPIAAFRPCCAADTGETVVRDPTAQPTSSSPFDRERQRAIILQAANSVNLFVKPVTFSDEAAIRAQKAGRRRHASLWAHCRWPPMRPQRDDAMARASGLLRPRWLQVKTWIYIPAVAILSVILVLFYLIQKQTIRLSPAINTYADYQAIAGFEPSCPCSHAPKVQDAVQLVIGTSSNFSVNACGSLMNMCVPCEWRGEPLHALRVVRTLFPPQPAAQLTCRSPLAGTSTATCRATAPLTPASAHVRSRLPPGRLLAPSCR